MKSKKLAVAILMISIVMIISGTVCAFVVSLKADREATQARMLVVNDEFESFNKSVTSFEEAREALYTQYLGNVFYDTLANDDPMLKERISNYESIVDSIDKQVKTMNGLCKDVYYPDSSVNSKCQDYKLVYEQVVNYFVGDVGVYNNTIKTFNEQQAAVGSTLALVEYESKKDYIDFNKDGAFDGKEVK